ncbi:MAG: DUF2085 domain-containing protein [Acidobacteriota bacterium]
MRVTSGRYSPASWVLVAAASIWVGLVLAPPLLHHAGWTGAEQAIRFGFRPICHQIPARSPALLGQPIAVCARCLGLYSGFLIGACFLPCLGGLSRRLEAHPRLLVLFFVPMFLDLVVWQNTMTSRWLSGAVAAFPLALFVRLALEQLPSSRLLRSHK